MSPNWRAKRPLGRLLRAAPVLRVVVLLVASIALAVPAGSSSARAEKSVVVSVSQQTLWAFKGDKVVLSSYVSTGRPGFDTPLGSYVILTKLASQTMEGVVGGEYYNVPEVPSVMYFTNYGHALHGTYWHTNFGAPMSHGCVNLPLNVADWLFRWAPLGTPVWIVP